MWGWPVVKWTYLHLEFWTELMIGQPSLAKLFFIQANFPLPNTHATTQVLMEAQKGAAQISTDRYTRNVGCFLPKVPAFATLLCSELHFDELSELSDIPRQQSKPLAEPPRYS